MDEQIPRKKVNKVVTIREIAKEAGVSPGTVSRVFHSPHMVKQSTRVKINEVIRKHNYFTNMYSSALSTKQTMTIGMVIPTVQSSIHAALIESSQDQCHKSGFSVLIGNMNYSKETETKLLETMLRRRVSGIIHGGTIDPDTLTLLRNGTVHMIPSVVVWENIDDDEISSIGIDNFTGAYMATQHLIENGHRDIGLLLGPYKKMNRLNDRLKGYQKCLSDAFIPFREEYFISMKHRIRDGAEGFRLLMQRCPGMTALFAASDVLAFGAIHQAKEEGKNIPQDISIVGFDDLEFASFSDPPLTTIRVPSMDMGRQAVNEIMDRIEHKRSEARHVSLPPELIKRKSVRKIF